MTAEKALRRQSVELENVFRDTARECESLRAQLAQVACYQCGKPIISNDDARVCIPCGGRNRVAKPTDEVKG